VQQGNWKHAKTNMIHCSYSSEVGRCFTHGCIKPSVTTERVTATCQSSPILEMHHSFSLTYPLHLGRAKFLSYLAIASRLIASPQHMQIC